LTNYNKFSNRAVKQQESDLSPNSITLICTATNPQQIKVMEFDHNSYSVN